LALKKKKATSHFLWYFKIYLGFTAKTDTMGLKIITSEDIVGNLK
jgi:hypothetical protein